MMERSLKFDVLRAANLARLPQFKNRLGATAHACPDGSDWLPGDWVTAIVGELGEFANMLKKFRRGDITLAEFAPYAAKELADVQIYLDILATRCLDHVTSTRVSATPTSSGAIIYNNPHPTGVDLGKATIDKFNEVSERVGSTVRIEEDGGAWYYLNDEDSTMSELPQTLAEFLNVNKIPGKGKQS